MDLLEVTEPTAVRNLLREHEITDAASLGACLEYPFVLQDFLIQLAALLHVHGTRFFAIDILPGAGGIDGRGRVPAVAGGDDDRIDVITCQQIAHVVVGLAFHVVVVAGQPHEDLAPFFLGIR